MPPIVAHVRLSRPLGNPRISWENPENPARTGHRQRCRGRSGTERASRSPGATVPASPRFPPHNYAGRRDRAPDPCGRHRTEEVLISAPSPATWAYAENFVPEDDVVARARSRAGELGCTAVAPGVGAVLRVLAATLSARSVVEIGTGAGVSGLYLLRGMPEEGVLTTIDVEVENQRAAREAFAEEGVRPNRTRLISGRALDVLPRLTDGAYDLVLVDAEKTEYEEYLEQALRLLRPGGVLAVDNALWHGKVADPAQRDATTTAVRELGKRVRATRRLVPAMLPCGDGLLVAVAS